MYKIYLRQLLRVMKLSTLIILIAIMQVSAATYAQKVTLSAKAEPLTTVLTQIKKQTGYDFAITGKVIEAAKPVTIKIKDADLKDALDQIFENQPLDYQIEDKSVTVTIKQPGILDKIKTAIGLDKIQVTGKIVGEDNLPLPGATIQIKNTNNSTITDAKGTFTLKNVEQGAHITISFIGYEKYETIAETDLGTIKLKPTTNPLDEVKVIAYGQTTDRLSVGNVSSVSAKEIAQQPVNNPLLALEGRVPGLIINQVNGLPGGAVKIQVQSINSINSGNDPLFVIDGVPYTANLPTNMGEMLGRGNVSIGYSAGNPFSYINPDDIESISVLKDASATSIYGSRAANGAILITTKKGKAGNTEVNINLQSGIGKVAKFLDLMGTPQYLAMRRQAFATDGLPLPSIAANPFDNNYDINGQWDAIRNVNWQKVLLGGSAHYTDVNGSISGGSDNIQYLVSGTFHRETTVFPGTSADTKGSLHFSLNSSSENKRFKLSFSGSYLVDNNHLPGVDLTNAAVTLAPNAPQLLNSDGTLNWAPTSSGTSSLSSNPLTSLLNNYQSKANNLTSNASFSYELFKGATIGTNLGYTNFENNEFVPAPLTSFPPEIRINAPNNAFFNTGKAHSWQVEPQFKYNTVIGKGKLDFLTGATINQSNTDNIRLYAERFPSDQLLSNIASATTVTAVASDDVSYKYAALFSRLGYNWDGKYLVEFSGRRDGSSRFGSANRFHDFWSTGIGWIFSEEKFIKDNVNWLSFGKIKASYGTTGNDQIGNYQYLSLYSPVASYLFQIPYQSSNALLPLSFSNPYIQWELTKKLNGGIDLGFLKDRILLSADYFHYRSSNQLLSYALPNITGFGGITSNFPATIQNTGFEFMISSVNIKSNFFSWSTKLNLTIPGDYQKLIAFPGLANSSYSTVYTVGQSIVTTKLYHFMGVNPASGIYQFSDGKGGVTSTPEADYTNSAYVRGDTKPKAYGGLTNTIQYKSLSLDFLLQFRKQNGFNSFKFGQFAGQSINQPAFIKNAWSKPGDVSTIQRLSTTINFPAYFAQLDLNSSDAVIEDASFIKLKNVSLSWNVPSEWIKRAGLKSAKLYTQGQNLLTFTKFSGGLDPETQSPYTLPPLRVITFGVQVGL